MALLCGTLAALATLTAAPSAHAADSCPNAQLRAENNSLSLPDCRAYELVSPLQKNGGAVQGFGAVFGGGVLQAAADGEAATFSSSASFGAAPQGAPPASQYLARRTQGGWSTENITQPTLSGAYGEAPDGVPYRLFSADLARGLLLDGARCAPAEPCPHSYSLRDDESGALTTSPAEPDLAFAGASPDLRQIVLSTCAALTTEATEQPLCESGGPNLYEWSGGELRLLNLLEGDSQGSSDAHLAAPAGAISADGQRVYFNDGEEAFLYLREGEAGAKPVSADPGASFQTATPDGSIAFYTKGTELLRYHAAAGTSEAIATAVLGVLGASADGSTVYYQDAAGLEQWREGTITTVAAGPEAALASDYPPATGTARLSADGEALLFLSKAQLTGYDNADQASGEPDSEVYLYEAAGGGGGSLACLSCNPSGARPLGPSSIPGSVPNGSTDSYRPRVLSADARRVFFDSADRVLPTDANTASDVYLWEAQGTGTCQRPGGCLALISSGAGSEPSAFIDASADGRDAFFITAEELVPTDPGSIDLYDAREAGGFPQPRPPIPCQGDACQPLPSPPEDPSPGTLVPGPGNPPLHFTRPHKRRRDHRRKHHTKHTHRKHHTVRPTDRSGW